MKDNMWSLNGKIVPEDQAVISLKSVAMKYAASVFEGIRCYKMDTGQLNIFALNKHINRLFKSMDLLGFEYSFSHKDVLCWIEELLKAKGLIEDSYIRCAASITSPEGINASYPILLSIDAFPKSRSPYYEGGCNLKISSWRRIGEEAMPPQIKTIANYSNARLATLEVRHDGYDLPLLLNQHGTVAESATACIFFKKSDRIITPALYSDILDSITRSYVIDIINGYTSYTVEERQISRIEALSADEAFLVGTGAEVIPVKSIDNIPFLMGHETVTEELKAHFFKGVRTTSHNYCKYHYILQKGA